MAIAQLQELAHIFFKHKDNWINNPYMTDTSVSCYTVFILARACRKAGIISWSLYDIVYNLDDYDIETRKLYMELWEIEMNKIDLYVNE